MNVRRITAVVIATAAWVTGFGLLGESEANASGYSTEVAYAVYPDRDADIYPRWSTCAPGTLGYNEPVYITADFTVYGDQDGNGYIDGDDCNWR